MLRTLVSAIGRLFMHHPVAPYAMVLLAVESIIAVYYSVFEPSRIWFELLISGAITVAVAFPTIALVLRQHRKVEALKSDLEQLSATDRMTGLLNRQSFLMRLEELVGRTPANISAGSFAYLDADRFKQINDSHGHMTGDRVIELIAQSIRDSVRKCDLTARLGGEEFGIFLAGATGEQAGEVADRIRRTIAEARLASPIPLPEVSVSIGVAAHKPGEGVTVTMQEADESLYAAKQAGRNAVVIELRRYRGAA